jgi:hypothetical protein
MDAQNQNPTLLDYTNQGLTELPPLPQGLETLHCDDNNLQSLPDLPDTLEELYCDDNNLKTLPKLPDSLEFLFCARNDLTELPNLPNSLLSIDCGGNALLEELPKLPKYLTQLKCNATGITKLPDLPNTINFLDCNYTEVDELPKLPDNLMTLNCSSVLLKSIPKLPSELIMLLCTENLLTRLPDLPTKLQILKCKQNTIVELPTLPDSLIRLDCDFYRLNDAGFQKMLMDLGSATRVALAKKTKCAIIKEVERRAWTGYLPQIFTQQHNDCEDYEDSENENDDEPDEEAVEENANANAVHVIEPLPDIPLEEMRSTRIIPENAIGSNIFDATEENVLEFLKKDPDNIVFIYPNVNITYYLYDRSYLRIVPENLTYICKKAYEHGLDVTGRLENNTIYFSMRKLGMYGIVPAHQIKQIIETKHQHFIIVATEKRAPSTAGYEVVHNLINDFTSRSHCQEGQDDTVYSIFRETFIEKRRRSASTSKDRSSSQPHKRRRSTRTSKRRSSSQTHKRTHRSRGGRVIKTTKSKCSQKNRPVNKKNKTNKNGKI